MSYSKTIFNQWCLNPNCISLVCNKKHKNIQSSTQLNEKISAIKLFEMLGMSELFKKYNNLYTEINYESSLEFNNRSHINKSYKSKTYYRKKYISKIYKRDYYYSKFYNDKLLELKLRIKCFEQIKNLKSKNN
jgi:hypothetical protein